MPAFELRVVAPIRWANILAVISFVLYGVLALVMIPFFLFVFMVVPKIANLAGPGSHPPPPAGPPVWVIGFMAIAYPFIGAAMGWVMGALGALTYNIVVRFTGGILVEFAPRESIET